jgi:hypothetical protein
MQDVSLVITTLTIAASLSLVIERLLEVIKHFRDEANAKIEEDQVTKSSKLSIEEAKEVIGQLKSVLDAYKQAKDLNVLRDVKTKTALPPPQPAAELDMIAEEQEDTEFERHDNITIVRSNVKSIGEAQTALVLALFAVGLGVILAEVFNLKLISLFLGTEVSHWADITLTGLVIGGGSQPIHVLLRFLTSRKITAIEQAQTELREREETAPTTITPSSQSLLRQKSESDWQPIVYKGGVNPESMERCHLRPQEPDLIVYHHTAMSSSVPFKGIVDEFLVNKGWLTGYHSVIMPDGTIHPFCRWDRYGNHAKGLNKRSLGIAFHGNFHTLANDRYSNHDGRFGIQEPTTAQLDAGARLVALWVHLYDDLQLDFDTDILPHKTAMPGHTVCPGSNFPHGEFRTRISFYYEQWNESEIQQHIALFKEKPFIYATA